MSVIMFIIMFIGGCAGSTTGGIKIFRLLLLFRISTNQIKRLTHPHGVFITSLNEKSVDENIFLRGAAAEFQWKKLNILAFGSNK